MKSVVKLAVVMLLVCVLVAPVVAIMETFQDYTVTSDLTQNGGGIAMYTANVQSVVNMGIFSFLFDNRPNPGGIWDASETELLSEIPDPHYGIVKAVHIEYLDDGVAKVIDAMEYPVINL